MKLHEKIKQIRKEKGLTQDELHQRIVGLFGESSITKRTLQRIETGHNDGRGASLYQICTGLDINLRTLQEGTDPDETTGYVRWDTYKGRYVYNEKAFASLMSARDMEFLAMKLNLEPGAKTRLEKDIEGEKKAVKWVYVLKGVLTCCVEDQKYILKVRQAASFNSAKEHHFENNSNRKAVGLVIQHPRHI
jgi:transcriptional regulator with XRE-family HTH domain